MGQTEDFRRSQMVSYILIVTVGSCELCSIDVLWVVGLVACCDRVWSATVLPPPPHHATVRPCHILL